MSAFKHATVPYLIVHEWFGGV